MTGMSPEQMTANGIARRVRTPKFHYLDALGNQAVRRARLPVSDMPLPNSSSICSRVPSLNAASKSSPEMDPRTVRWKSANLAHPSSSQNCYPDLSNLSSGFGKKNKSSNLCTNPSNSSDSSFDNFDVNFGISLVSPKCTNREPRPIYNRLLITGWNHDLVIELWSFILRLAGKHLVRRFSGPNGGSQLMLSSSFLHIFVVAVTACLFMHVTDACSSRSTPKPRPPSPTLRPNITIQTYTCPPEYDAHYCLNGASCFTVKIGDSILYNCECAEGYMGQRCEFKDLDGSYLPSKQRAMLEQAGITSGVVIIIILVVIICSYLYVRSRRKPQNQSDNEIKCDLAGAVDNVDSNYRLVLPGKTKEKRPFSKDNLRTRDC